MIRVHEEIKRVSSLHPRIDLYIVNAALPSSQVSQSNSVGGFFFQSQQGSRQENEKMPPRKVSTFICVNDPVHRSLYYCLLYSSIPFFVYHLFGSRDTRTLSVFLLPAPVPAPASVSCFGIIIIYVSSPRPTKSSPGRAMSDREGNVYRVRDFFSFEDSDGTYNTNKGKPRSIGMAGFGAPRRSSAS